MSEQIKAQEPPMPGRVLTPNANPEEVVRAWHKYISERIDAELERTGQWVHATVVDRTRRQERRRSFEAGYRTALAAAMAGMTTEWCVLQPRVPGLHRGPYQSREAVQAWIDECEADGFRPGAFVVGFREVTEWREVTE